MGNTERCSDCARYEREGDNFCRVCGFHLMKDYAQHSRLNLGYTSDEKYCGYCGDPKDVCSCVDH
jgi:RNA polymerase subunit RPABC4/transcription elongation factor Spt4